MQIFYLNLDTEPGRRAYMEAQFAEAGVSGERVKAITPRDIVPDVLRQACDKTRRHWVSPTELACTMTHRLAWREIIERNLPMALILEDDVVLSHRLPELLAAVEPLSDGLDVIRIETQQPDVRLGQPDRRNDTVELRQIHMVVWGCGGYIVTNAGARRLLGPLSRLDVPVDAAIFNYHLGIANQLRTRQAVPAGIANGDAARQLKGEVFATTIGAVRRPTDEPEPTGLRSATDAAVRRWGGIVSRRRDRIRGWLDRRLRGIEAVDIPLL